MSTYVSVTLQLDSLSATAVQHHIPHDDGTTSWRIEGDHDPIYLNGTLDSLRRFAASVQAAIDAEDARLRHEDAARIAADIQTAITEAF